MKTRIFRFAAALLAAAFAAVALPAEEFVAVAGKEGLFILRRRDGIWQIAARHPEKGLFYLAGSADDPAVLFGALRQGAVRRYAVRRYAVRRNGTVAADAPRPTGGRTCCHVSCAPGGRGVYAANYSSASVAFLTENGSLSLLRHTGGRPGAPRQTAPHPHFAAPTPDERFLAVADLGLDRVFLYPIETDGAPSETGRVEIELPEGSGPRHLLFSPDGGTLYVADELDSTLSVLKRENGEWRLLRQFPATAKASPKRRNYPGALRFSSDRNWLFLTNRGADTVALFRILADGMPEARQEFPVAPFPSDILELGGTIFVACSKGDAVEVLDFDAGNGVISSSGAARIPIPGAIALSPGEVR